MSRRRRKIEIKGYGPIIEDEELLEYAKKYNKEHPITDEGICRLAIVLNYVHGTGINWRRGLEDEETDGAG